MEQDRLFCRAGEQLAPPDMGVPVRQVAIERERGFVFGNRFLEAVLRTKHLCLDKMHWSVIGGMRQGLYYQFLCAFDVRSTRGRHIIEHAACQSQRQINLGLRGVRTEG
jgi:hypothetical protein